MKSDTALARVPNPSVLPSVAVIVPTTGRPELLRALQSVASQDYLGEIQTLAVVDRVDNHNVIERARELSIACIDGGGNGAAHARNLGVQSAACDLIAFLDDDDSWHPSKIRHQVDAIQDGWDIVSSRVQLVMSNSNQALARNVPQKLLSRDEDVARYLFRNRRPGSRRSSLYTSTILARASVCSSVAWRTGLVRHQDWDWLIRAQQSSASVVQLPDELVCIHVGSSGSISGGTNWRASLEWAEATLADRRTRSDFLAAQTLRYALHAKDARGCALTVRAIARTQALPSPGCIAIGAAGILQRGQVERLMRWVR